MPLPVIADTIRTAVQFQLVNGHRAANILHFRKTVALTNTGAITILDPLLTTHLTVASSGSSFSWKQHAPSSSQIVSIAYTPLDGTTATTVVNKGIAGALTAVDPLPTNVALVATLRTAHRGRSYRGRVYECSWSETQNDVNGTPGGNAAFVAKQWTDFITALSGTGVSLVVASYLLHTAENVTTVTCDPRWDTQRRRLN